MCVLAGILLTLTLLTLSVSTCPENKIRCLCGNTNVTVSVPCNQTKALVTNPCNFLEFCETCADNVEHCLTCPKGTKGSFCNEVDESWFPPGSRIFPRDTSRFAEATNHRFLRDTSCPKLKSPVGGIIRCSYSSYLSECTANCIPGFSFENYDDQITVRCEHGRWTPFSSFPPCKSGGDCDLEVVGAGSYNCTYGVQGTQCDIRCSGRGRRYSCYPGRPWSPPLPPCVKRKGAQEIEEFDCGCHNGGTCDHRSHTCRCPPRFQGVHCETLERTVYPAPDRTPCPNPGYVSNADRMNPDGTLILSDHVFYPGSVVVYNCKVGFALFGKSLLTCSESRQWSSSPPICNRVRQKTTSTTESPEEVTYCDDPGMDPNGERLLVPWLGPRSFIQDTQKGKYPQGFQIDYSCKQGYTIVGANSLTCLISGIWSTNLPTCERSATKSDCGRSLVQYRRKITHGEMSSEGEWPWQVAIAESRGGKLDLFCGAVLINPRTVATAAHCIMDKIPEEILLYFGKFHLDFQKDDKEVSVRTPSNFIVHPNFNKKTLDADIALIKFSPDIQFTARVQPICLPTPENTRKDLVLGSSGLVTGWGVTENNKQPDVLLMAEIPIVPTRPCRRYYEQRRVLFQLTKNMFCGGYRGGKVDTCRGDSGGPMVFFDREARRYVLEGLVSFGVTKQCGRPEWYAVYTKVGNFVRWIKQNT